MSYTTKNVNGVDVPLTAEEIAELEARDAAWAARPVPVPKVVTMRQARRALLAFGKLDAVATAIAGLSEPDKAKALIDWEYSQEVQRDWPLVAALAPALGLSEAQIDQLFITARTL